MSKYFSRTAAAVLAAALAVPTGAAVAAESDDELVTFIVQTAAGTPTAVLRAELNEGSTMSAAAVNARITAEDDRLEEKNETIRDAVAAKTGADISDSYIYTQLDSGFSVTARRSDRDKILAVDGVTDIFEAGVTEIVPDDEETDSLKVMTSAVSEEYKGQGTLIAVLDSGFALSHEYFAEAPAKVKYSKEEAQSLISDIGRGIYYSDKIPFAYDYYQKSSTDAAISNYADHGTHVAGIAAGKNGVISNGDVISGTAPEAQLALMACGSSATGINDAAYIAALNDAAKLGADVINMSFGGSYLDIRQGGYDARRTAVANARKAGIVVCASSSNDSRGFYNTEPLVTDLDYGSGGLWQKDTNVISVASADLNEYYITLTEAVIGDGSVVVGTDHEAKDISFRDTVTGETEYVYCGFGKAGEIAAADLLGKVAVMQRGGLTFSEKTTNAKNAGAVAAVIYDNTDEAYPSVTGFTLPTLFLKKADGEALIAQEKKTICAIGQGLHKDINANGGKPSYFSSWGVSETLELVPNIMGLGGNMYSAAPNGGYQEMSGTSMSSPYMAGVCASVKSYLNTAPFGELGINTADLIQQLIMSTADPVRYDSSGIAYSPRQQGAGLVNAEAAVKTPVVLFNSDNKTLVNLGDEVGTEFELKFTAHNYSNDDITLNSTSVEAMTDDHIADGGKYYVGEMKALTAEYTDSPITVNANEDAEITIDVKLDAEELKKNSEIFTNGFYIDGFVRLSGDQCSVGLPFMGFYGDWGKMPIWDTTVYDEGGSSLISTADGVNGTYLETAVNGKPDKLGSDPNTDKLNKSYMIISPANKDSKMDSLGVVFALYRASHNIRFELIGETSVSKTVNGYYSKFKSNKYSYTNLSQLRDGEYAVRLTGWFDDGTKTTEQTLEFPYKVIIDNTAPEIAQTLSHDQTELAVKVSDDHYIRSVTVSYTDTEGEAHSETKTLDCTAEEYENTFALTNADLSTLAVTAADYAYNSKEQKYIDLTAEVSAAFAERADKNLENDTDATGFVTIISGRGSASKIKWTISSDGRSREFETTDSELAAFTLNGASLYIGLILDGLYDSAAQASASAE